MDRSNPPVSIDQLKAQERGYRRQVTHEPTNISARANLAWCLFLQTMHQAGRENLLDLMERNGSAPEEPVSRFRLDRDAQALLQECLVEMLAVHHLSQDPEYLADVERLRHLVRISGGEAALQTAETEAERWRASIATEMLSNPPTRRRRRYRRTPRGI